MTSSHWRSVTLFVGLGPFAVACLADESSSVRASGPSVQGYPGPAVGDGSGIRGQPAAADVALSAADLRALCEEMRSQNRSAVATDSGLRPHQPSRPVDSDDRYPPVAESFSPRVLQLDRFAPCRPRGSGLPWVAPTGSARLPDSDTLAAGEPVKGKSPPLPSPPLWQGRGSIPP